MGQGIADRAMHLRNAAQRVGILHLLALAMRFANQAALQHAAQVLGDQYLPGMRTRLLNARVKRSVGTFECIHGECAEYVRGIREDIRLQEGQQSHGQHALGAIDERDCLLGLQHQRLNLRLLQRFRGRHALAAKGGFALGDQHQREMRQRRQIATGPYAPLGWNDGMHATIQHLAKRIDDRGPHP